jgi:hypothetical protein
MRTFGFPVIAAALVTLASPAIAQKTNRYSPAIERAYAARAVAMTTMQDCRDKLTLNDEVWHKLEKESGLSDNETAGMEAADRAEQAFTRKLAEAAAQRGWQGIRADQKCVLILYTFGPNGSWIKGLVSEK